MIMINHYTNKIEKNEDGPREAYVTFVSLLFFDYQLSISQKWGITITKEQKKRKAHCIGSLKVLKYGQLVHLP